MVSVLLSILADFADTARVYFSSFGMEALGVLAIVVVLKIAAEYYKNRVEVDWGTLRTIAHSKNVSEIMSLEWEPYYFWTRYVLAQQDYRIKGSSVNDLSGIDIIAEKDGKRTLFRFGRSTAETINEREIRDLLVKAQQFNASSGCIISPGSISSSAERCVKNVPLTVLKRSDLIEWLNQYAGANLHSSHSDDQNISNFGPGSYSSSDSDILAA